ncbi:het-E-1 heterokaryon incompatibility protein [Fusarium tjaetaba]|uniref:Het-E-1 heterokaryon incompatibility protein n=1 Tax=Fusarium tjaetaba TaxID=1567544 RepID=A0A8H5QYG0_9HYPO|nr:het-E-1 heterokaryon incompatibility protein [Fusarium tjaetaba]KAF5622086.1 het-E-1 heterokaryon incompatibility protein [Fusarium tjaetaba]
MDFDDTKNTKSYSDALKVDPNSIITTSIDAVPVTVERKPYQPGVDKPRLAHAGVARANLAATHERPEGTTESNWAQRHQDQTVLQQHCDFFDKDHDGVIWPLDTFRGFYQLGYGIILSVISVLVIHGNFSYPTQSSLLPDPFFRIHTNNIHKDKHGSDTGTYDTEGRFVPQKFEDIFSKYAEGRDYLTIWDVMNLMKGQRLIADPIGWGGAFFEYLMPNFNLFSIYHLLCYKIDTGRNHPAPLGTSWLTRHAYGQKRVNVKEWLASLEQGIQPNATATEQIDALIEQTTKKQKVLDKPNHRFRKYFDKIIHWLDKVKGIGDVVSSFDPVHAALPWAAFRFALQAVLAEKEQAESVLELLASTPHFVFSGRVLEMVYTKDSMHIGEAQDDIKLTQQCLDHLHEELIKFYSSLLSALQYCYRISSKDKVKRKAIAIFNPSEVVSIRKDLEVQHKKVIACGENCHKIFNHTLSSKSLDLLQKIQPTLTKIGDRVQKLLVRIDEEKRRKTLGAISSILFRSHHDEVSRKRTTGTCEWILKRETFIRWEESDSSVTILYGNPGAGKTFLISRIIDYSIERAKTGDAVAFFYCKRDEENRRNPQDILRSILRQLSTPIKEVESATIHIAVKDLPSRLELNGTTFDVATCESLIGKLADDYRRTTIILDALDECDRNTREELMRVLSNLTNERSKLRVFISSRHDEDILRHFKGRPVMTVEATDNEEDISSYVQDKLFRDTRWSDIGPRFQEEVQSVFHKKSQGMFQWAALQVDQIRRLKLWSERSIREQLETSPIGLKGAYDVVWNQIQEMSSYEQQLARRALQWVLCAFRPLKTTELSLMMLIERDSGTIEGDIVFTPETIQSICGNLLVYDRQSNVWRFSHLSAREYIETHHYNMIESHHHIAISSIRFLERDLVLMPRDTKPFPEPEPTLWVIARNRSHADGPCVKLTVQCHYIVKSPYRTSTPLQVMSIYGLFHILRDLWENAGGELDICPKSTSSPLTLAVQNGHESMWRFILLAKGKLNNGYPGPLVAAIQHNNEKAFEALIEAKADVNYGTFTWPYCTGEFDTPLKAALSSSIKQNRRYIIQRLLDGGADVNLRIGSVTAMELAIKSADEETVKLLLDANTKAYNPNYFLSLAAQNEKFNLITLFVNLGANVEEPWEGALPLVLALREGNISAVQYLLEMPDILWAD